MNENRRKFLKLTGLAALGAATGKFTNAFAKEKLTKISSLDMIRKKRTKKMGNGYRS
jgi:hypothetical protein